MSTQPDSTPQATAEALLAEVVRLRAFLHEHRMHPDYEYETTTGRRKCFDEHEPAGEGWERNREEGRNGWERFDYHEEAYWRRLKPSSANGRDEGRAGNA